MIITGVIKNKQNEMKGEKPLSWSFCSKTSLVNHVTHLYQG